MSTKANPGKFDAYLKAADDEPMFVLLARDPLAPILVSLWAALREHEGELPDKVAAARTCAVEMMRWRGKPPTVAELEAILQEDDQPCVINPDGSVTLLNS